MRPVLPPRARPAVLVALVAVLAALLSSCVSGENADGTVGAPPPGGATVRLDYAYYNPLSLVIKEQGWLEQEFGPGSVQWVLSQGSNKANENLRARVVDIGSTAGTPALLARANGSPIKSIDVYSRPEWSAIVVRGDSPIASPAQLRGRASRSPRAPTRSSSCSRPWPPRASRRPTSRSSTCSTPTAGRRWSAVTSTPGRAWTR